MGGPKGMAVLLASSGRNVHINWALSIAQLTFPVGMNYMWNVSIANPNADPTKLITRDQQRESLLEGSVNAGMEFSLFLDDDTISPPRTPQELFYVMAQNPKAGIVGGIYCTKEIPTSPIVFMELGAGPHWQWTLGDVFKCKGLGTGCMMIRNSILKDVPKPWFKDFSEAPLNEFEMRGGEKIRTCATSGTDDIYFCKKVDAAGYEIIAHGGVLPVHVDQDGVVYKIPKSSYPVTSYAEKLAAVNAGLPEGQKKVIL